MKRRSFLILVAMLVLSIPVGSFAWGVITHSYLASELGAPWGEHNIQEIYGATLPDMFNLMYGSPYEEYLWTQTHYEFMQFADRATAAPTVAVAYGFASHNDAWGADHTAHHSAITNPGEGYVITKVNAIVPALTLQIVEVLTTAGVPDAAEVAERLAPGLAENFVETAVDVLIKRNEAPGVGFHLLLSAQLRDMRVPFMLTGAYAEDFAQEFGISKLMANLIILGAENQHRDFMKLYGGIFTRNEDQLIDLLGELGAVLAKVLLEAETGYDVTVSASLMSDFFRNVAIPAVEPDYGSEIAATLAYLETAMPAHGFAASPGPVTTSGRDEFDVPGSGEHTLTLDQNQPNPFNPITTISFHLAEETPVRLSIYDPEGRLVKTLIDARLPQGSNQTVWDGTDARGNPVSSGVYFYRLHAAGKVLTKKMVMLR